MVVPLRSFTREKLNISWHHDKKKNLLHIKSALGNYFFQVPNDWELKKWSPALRKLAEVLIFEQFWEPKDFSRFMDACWTPWLTPKKDVIEVTPDIIKVEIEAVNLSAANPSNPSESITSDQLPDESPPEIGSTATLEIRIRKDVETTNSVTEPEKLNEITKEDAEKAEKARVMDDHLRRWNRRQEKNISAISFSGGLDSCAIAPLIEPKFFMCYLKRKIDQPTMLRHKQQLIALEHIKKRYDCTAYIMESDIEMIAMHSIGRVGFPSEYACALPCVIMADYIGITAIATGTIGLFLKGYKSHNFSKTGYFKFWKRVFLKGGIELFWPVGGVVDRGTAIICEKLGIPGQSCVRNDNGFCNRCFKCFRKNTLLLNKFPKEMNNGRRNGGSMRTIRIPPDAKLKLAKKPLTLIELYQKGILRDRHLEPYKNLDLSYQSHYLKECYDYMIPARMKKRICGRLDKFLGPMNDEQIKMIKELDLTKLSKFKIDLDGGFGY